MGKMQDFTGKKFGRWTVIRKAESNKHNHRKWLCRCECGTLRIVFGQGLTNGTSKSCGCYHLEVMTQKITTHGCSYHNMTSEYSSWICMKSRCLNPNFTSYPRYGGVGIKVSEEWINSFENFFADMGKKPTSKHSLDRFPNKNGNYEASNCRWATSTAQNRNRNNNRWIECNGENLIITDWAAKFKIDASWLCKVLKRKPIAEAYNYYMNKKI